jgi:hypothetical protein
MSFVSRKFSVLAMRALTDQIRIRPYALFGPDGVLGCPAPERMGSPDDVWRRGFYSWTYISTGKTIQMYELFDEYASRIADYEGKAKSAGNEDDRHSWLAMADSWRHTAQLRQLLERQERDVHMVVAKAVTGGLIHTR